MDRELLKLINNFNTFQADRSEIQVALDKEVKAQKMCVTQLKGLEKKLTEKMERRERLLEKYNAEFANSLAELPNSIKVFDEIYGANVELKLFGKEYVMFNINGLECLISNSAGDFLNEIAEKIIRSRVILGNPYSASVEGLVKLDKEIKKNPTLAKDKLLEREVKQRKNSIKEEIQKAKQSILEDEQFLNYYNQLLEGKEPAKKTLTNRLLKRRQLKTQETVEKLKDGIAINNSRIESFNAQLKDEETLRLESKEYVETQLEKLTQHIALIEQLDSIKGKLEVYNKRYVAPIQDQINQHKTAIKSSDTMQEIHKAELNNNAEQIDEFLEGCYQNKELLDKLLKITKKECTPEQWKIISLIKQHYNVYVSNQLDDLLTK